MLALRTPTPAEWLDAVMGDFDAFLVDHAACERKASATGMAFVVRYPDRHELIEPMIAFAREELEHFQEVVRICLSRGLTLESDAKDPYIEGLMPWVRGGRDERLLDRLIMASVVEARGCERFAMVAEALPQGELAAFYAETTRAEARHAGLFCRLAKHWFSAKQIDARVESMLDHESNVMEKLALRPALH